MLNTYNILFTSDYVLLHCIDAFRKTAKSMRSASGRLSFSILNGIFLKDKLMKSGFRHNTNYDNIAELNYRCITGFLLHRYVKNLFCSSRSKNVCSKHYLLPLINNADHLKSTSTRHWLFFTHSIIIHCFAVVCVCVCVCPLLELRRYG